MKTSSLNILLAVAACLPLAACAPMPKLRANWYAVLDTESTLLKPSPDQPTKEVYRRVLAILNEDMTPVTISDVYLNPSWTRAEDKRGTPLSKGHGARLLLPGEMLLFQVKLEEFRTSETLLSRPRNEGPWRCEFPTRVRLNAKMEKQVWKQHGYEVDAKDVVIPIAQPFPSSLPLGWMHGCEMAPGVQDPAPPATPASAAGS